MCGDCGHLTWQGLARGGGENLPGDKHLVLHLLLKTGSGSGPPTISLAAFFDRQESYVPVCSPGPSCMSLSILVCCTLVLDSLALYFTLLRVSHCTREEPTSSMVAESGAADAAAGARSAASVAETTAADAAAGAVTAASAAPEGTSVRGPVLSRGYLLPIRKVRCSGSLAEFVRSWALLGIFH